KVKSPAGEETIESQALISAVGQLNRPKMPDIAGITSFEGPYFHSAQWDHSVDLTGKVVAVIGSGASASQLIPEVAIQARELKVFQRTPNYYVPVPNYHDAVPDGLQWLFRHIPGYAQWYRFWLFWTSAEGLLAMAEVAPDWQPGQPSLGPKNDELRMMLSAYLQASFADRPDLLEKVLPQYPPASKRIVLDNGIWVQALHRENVQLITELIDEVTPRGIRTSDGVEHEVDVIVYATGFQASHFLTPMKVSGRNGADLHQTWDGDARAYMGITLPQFPNFFMLYGPNTNIVVNGSIVYFSECEVQYLMACLRMLLERGATSLECKQDVHDAYNERIDAGNLRMAWGVAEVPSWYRNEKGRSAQNWPFTLLEYWKQTREANPADYVLAGAP
ncbi:MAG: NAD(P)/FAD-dependent oxidoreductase, partial [Dehalococcoidia bacterium]